MNDLSSKLTIPGSKAEENLQGLEIDPRLNDAFSLRQRAARKVTLSLLSGKCPPIAGSRVRLIVGQRLIVDVEPPEKSRANIVAETVLYEVVPETEIHSGSVTVLRAEFIARLHRIASLPIPATGILHITINDGLESSPRMDIPIIVCPNFLNYFWWWTFIFLGFFGIRWLHFLSNGKSANETMTTLLQDAPIGLAVFIIGHLVAITLWLGSRYFSFLLPDLDP